jgi:hypothetical protein
MVSPESSGAVASRRAHHRGVCGGHRSPLGSNGKITIRIHLIFPFTGDNIGLASSGHEVQELFRQWEMGWPTSMKHISLRRVLDALPRRPLEAILDHGKSTTAAMPERCRKTSRSGILIFGSVGIAVASVGEIVLVS